MVSLEQYEQIEKPKISNWENSIANILQFYRKINLQDMEEVKLLNRMDSKYWFSINLLPQILTDIAFHYQVLEVNGKGIQNYGTQYFDTPQDQFYLEHHNGKQNRIKVRKRAYSDAGIQFLEVKQKNHKGLTSKIRTSTRPINGELNPTEIQFLDEHIQENPHSLQHRIENRFKRITLVDLNRTERCTVDFDIEFSCNQQTQSISQLAIIELKRSDRNAPSRLGDFLNQHRIKPNGFSKYCIGRALMQPTLKQNRIKESLLKIKQLSTERN